MGASGIGRSLGYRHVYTPHLLDAEASYQCRKDFASRIKSDDEPTSVTLVGNSADSPEPLVRPWPATGHDVAILSVEDPYAVGIRKERHDARDILRPQLGVRVVWMS
jgi:hypothetical protein